jgi:endoglucanase
LPGTYTKCSTTPSSSASGPSSSASSAVALIEDFQDGNVTAESLEDGGWFLYEADGSISNTKKANGDWDMIRSSGSSKYASMEGISLVPTTDKPYPSVGMGLALVEGAFTNCSAIQYDYKGSGHFFRADMSTITPEKGYEYQTEEQENSTSWKTVTVTADDLDQPSWVYQDPELASEIKSFNWAKVYQLVWFVSMDIQSQGTSLQIDNVKCLGTLPEVVISSSASSSSGVANSSAAAFSSSAVVSSSSHASSTDVALIDDFEDGDNVAYTGVKDYWYIFTDSKDGGATSIRNDLGENDDYVVVFPEAAAGGSDYGAGLTGIVLEQGDNEYEPYVTIGVDIAIGLAGCTEISYKYKGASHNLKAVIRGDEKGVLTKWNRHKKRITGSSSWTTAVVDAPSKLEQEENWGTKIELRMADVVQLQWEVKETAANQANLDYGFLYIDDVKCSGMTIVPFSSSSSSPIPSSTSVGPATSSSAQPEESSSSESQMFVQKASVSAGLSATVHGNTLQVTVERAGLVKVRVFDMMGHAIESHSESMAAGSFAHTFGSMGKGAYIVRVQQGSTVKTLRMQVR